MASDIPTSPIPHLFESNSIPSDDERDATHQFIGGLQTKIAAIDEEIARFKSLLAAKESERWAIHEVVHRHKGVISPVRTLAPEILAEIFLHTIPSDMLEVYPVPGSPFFWQMPLLVSKICRKWREVALATPRLWSILRCFYLWGSDNRVTPSRHAVLLSLWASRSGACDLRVCVDFDGPYLQPSSLALPSIRPIMDLSHRWSKLVLIFEPPMLQTIHTQFFGRLEGRMPNLEELSLISSLESDYERSHPQPPPPTNTVFDNVHTNPITKLKRLFLHVKVYASPLTLPLQQLTTLHLYIRSPSTYATVTTCLEILENAPNLIDFRARCGSELDSEVEPPDSVHHHNLQTFHIIAWKMDEDLKVLFDSLTLPALKDFDLWVLGSEPLDDDSEPLDDLCVYDNEPLDDDSGPLDDDSGSLDDGSGPLNDGSGLLDDGSGLVSWNDLFFHNSAPAPRDDPNFLGPFLRRAGGGLIKVGIKDDTIKFRDIIEYLHLTPLATDVDIKAITIEDKDFHKFATMGMRTTSEVLLPRLQRLKISGNIWLTQATFLDFLKARWNPEDQGVCRLRSVEVLGDSGKFLTAKGIQNVLSYRDQGLSIQIFSNKRRIL